MKRSAEKTLLTWFRKKDRPPLILRGARQVGKSTLVRLFCAAHDLDLIEINLEIHRIKAIDGEIFEMENILDEIQLLTRKKITDKSLLFIDEIQAQAKMVPLLRYFYEQRPHLAVIAAGSLLEIALRQEDFSFPVGRVEFCHLGPMSFKEFLLACHEEHLVEKIETLAFSATLHDLCLEYLKKYLFVGGMPKAVLTYIAQKSLVDVREVQQNILQTYIADFPKYRKRLDVHRIERVFQASAGHVGKKVIFQGLDRESKSRDIRQALELLIDARVLLPCFHAEAGGLPLAATMHESVFKFFLIDVGLMNCLHRLDFDLLLEDMGRNFVTRGVIAEQFIAQHLAFSLGAGQAPVLHYWLRDRGNQKGEIDFLLQHRNRIIPVEVKAEGGGRLRSLFYFALEKRWNHAIRFSCAPFAKQQSHHKIRSTNVRLDYMDVPLYAVEEIENILHRWFASKPD